MIRKQLSVDSTNDEKKFIEWNQEKLNRQGNREKVGVKKGKSSRLTGKKQLGSSIGATALTNAGDRPYICERTASYIGATARDGVLNYTIS